MIFDFFMPANKSDWDITVSVFIFAGRWLQNDIITCLSHSSTLPIYSGKFRCLLCFGKVYVEDLESDPKVSCTCETACYTNLSPTEYSMRTRTQVRHECTQVHGEKWSSKLAKSLLFRAETSLICHSEKKWIQYERLTFVCLVASRVHAAIDRYRE